MRNATGQCCSETAPQHDADKSQLTPHHIGSIGNPTSEN
jgi:hypothetical protein